MRTVASSRQCSCEVDCPHMKLASVLTCPACGHAERLEMPTAECVFFYECRGCHVLLKPKSGDCCVFCTYGSVPCPPIQCGNAVAARRLE